MVCKEACAECTQNCLLIHGKNKDPSPVVTSFFKVIVATNYSEKFMYLPPKFARTVSALVDQITRLEDSSGRHWEVKLTKVKGSLAFEQGWHEFSLEHGLDKGDVLVFYYILESHFVVQIYGLNGCQKHLYGKKNHQRKKCRTNRYASANDTPSHMNDLDLMNKQCSAVNVPGSGNQTSQGKLMAMDNTPEFDRGLQPLSAFEYVEEPFYMINRDAGYQQREDSSCLYDLSKFEMTAKRSDADGTTKCLVGYEGTSHHARTAVNSRSDVGLVAKDSATAEVATCVSPSDIANLTEKNKDSPAMDKVVLKSQKDSSSAVYSGHRFEKSALDPAKSMGNSKAISKIVKCQDTDERSIMNLRTTRKTAKIELMEMSETRIEKKIVDVAGQSSSFAVKENDKVLKVVKAEPIDSLAFPSVDAANISCLAVMGSQAFSELSNCLPSISFRRTRFERKVVLLRGPDAKLWPILYHEKYGIKVLTTGWEAFSKANDIQVGDKCAFGLETGSESIYKVSVSRK
ncbi:hypothetical protein RJ640_030310 [Escallonia rubra]|uniref:TF-B3 domain-containing protein n=1 Tax=Escallonia rubra TaxID=112253 RepID=A0AA88R0A5_9ASTE|nr:hypothetical protein RJ640_030310 [Escallonia rubra]